MGSQDLISSRSKAALLPPKSTTAFELCFLLRERIGPIAGYLCLRGRHGFNRTRECFGIRILCSGRRCSNLLPPTWTWWSNSFLSTSAFHLWAATSLPAGPFSCGLLIGARFWISCSWRSYLYFLDLDSVGGLRNLGFVGCFCLCLWSPPKSISTPPPNYHQA